jgi:quinol monooxygenase YgiN
MTEIKVNKNIITSINVFTVDPSKQQKLVDILVEAAEQVWNLQDGFISATIHKSLDGKKVVNYLQWKSKEAFEKRLDDPQAIIKMNKVLSMAKANGNLYQVVFTNSKNVIGEA